MGVRTTIALAAVALALLAYIVFFERGSLTTGELDKRKDDAVPEFVRDRVTRIEVQRRGQWTVLERGPDPEQDQELGRWKLVAPLRADADQDAVENLLAALEWMSVRRRIEGVSAEDRARFGFDAPRYRVRFTAGREHVLLVVGKPTPQGDGVYVQGKDRSVAHVVAKDVVDGLNHESGDYHTKELHDGLSSLTVKNLRVVDATGARMLAKVDAVWWLGEGGQRMLASEPAVDAVVGAVDRLRGKRFVATEAKDPDAYGFAAPFVEVQATSTKLVANPFPSMPGAPSDGPTAPPKPRTEEVTMRLVVGAECSGHAGERYARAEKGAVMCVAESDLADARKTPDDLRERRLLPFDATGVKAVRLERDGRALSLSRKDVKWAYALRAKDKEEASGALDEPAVVGWIESLVGARAERFDPISEHATAPPANGWRLRVEREDESAAYEATVIDSGAAGLRVRRGGEPWLAVYGSATDALLTPSVALERLRSPVPPPAVAPMAPADVDTPHDGGLFAPE